MKQVLFYSIAAGAACHFAADFLMEQGIPFVDHISPEITHLLLDVPSFRDDGQFRSGDDPSAILRMLPQSLTVVGGGLSHPSLEDRSRLDLLADPLYLAENAAITADCALQVAAPLLTTTFRDTPTLILGWGRIGKCLAQMLKVLGSEVTVAARNISDRAMLQALGYHAVEFFAPMKKYKLIFNTVPELVLPEESCPSAVKIDLASRRGMSGSKVVWARGLPGIHAPESSGRLIAKRVLEFLKEEKT